ncbi:MAG TPA: PAS domain S-box protein [Nitrospirota bacterium]|nr:PAS domain S-box protein [Nitrospirota bacterium]
MRKHLFIILGIFTLGALTCGIYLAYSFDRRLSDFNNIIKLHHVENLRERLLLNIRKVEIDLYSLGSSQPESAAAVEGHVYDIKTSINTCYGCHHIPSVLERLDDLRQQIEQYDDAVKRLLSLRAGTISHRDAHLDAHIIGDSLMGKVEIMVVRTSEKLSDQTEDSLQKAHRMKLVMIGLIAAGPLIMILFALTVLRGVTKPVQVLLQATRTLKAGDMAHRITGLKDEFGELAVAFNEMAGSLQSTMRAIEESEQRYRMLFEGAADAIFILEAEGDKAGRILQANQAAAVMHGYTGEELEGMNIRDLDSPESRAAAPARMERIRRGAWTKFEMSHQRKDGTVFPVEVSAGLLVVGGRQFILAVNRDLTERKRTEEAMQKTERIRVAGELATGLAHEIKNPLAGIKVSMQALSEENSLSDEDRDVLNRVIGEINRIEFLMKGLLNFARPPKPQLASTDVNAVLDTVASLVLKERSRSREGARAIRLKRELDEDLPEIMADPMQLQQIFMNLMLNAIDAMPEGGTVTMRTVFERQANSLRIELSDTGRGIDSATMAKIFDPFFTTKAKGTGLGLSITKRLVEEHGGSITLVNNHDGGVTCSITLPVRLMEGALTA